MLKFLNRDRRVKKKTETVLAVCALEYGSEPLASFGKRIAVVLLIPACQILVNRLYALSRRQGRHRVTASQVRGRIQEYLGSR